jgi:hypothetical protein
MTRDVAEEAPRSDGPAGRPNYYAPVSDRKALAEAALVEGIDDELAELRVRLRELIGERKPENFELIMRGMKQIVGMVAARYRMSAKSKNELASAAAAVIQGVAAQLWPEEDGDV